MPLQWYGSACDARSYHCRGILYGCSAARALPLRRYSFCVLLHSHCGQLMRDDKLPHNGLSTRLNKCMEETRPHWFICIHFFRMALSGQHKAMFWDLQQLCNTIFGATANNDTVTWLFGSLMMKAIHAHLACAQNLCHPATRLNRHFMNHSIAR